MTANVVVRGSRKVEKVLNSFRGQWERDQGQGYPLSSLTFNIVCCSAVLSGSLKSDIHWHF